MEELLNLALENTGIIGSVFAVLVTVIFGASKVVFIKKLARDIVNLYDRFEKLINAITNALDDKKITKTEIIGIKIALKALIYDFKAVISDFNLTKKK